MVQENVAQQRQVIREQTLAIEELKARAGSTPTNNSSDDEQSHKKKKSNPNTSGDPLRKDALQAGKRFGVQYALWTEPGAVQYLALFNSDGSDGHQSDESELDNDAEARAQAELIHKTLPAQLRPHVKEAWFRERVS
jgi:hypothetical protein